MKSDWDCLRMHRLYEYMHSMREISDNRIATQTNHVAQTIGYTRQSREANENTNIEGSIKALLHSMLKSTVSFTSVENIFLIACALAGVEDEHFKKKERIVKKRKRCTYYIYDKHDKEKTIKLRAILIAMLAKARIATEYYDDFVTSMMLTMSGAARKGSDTASMLGDDYFGNPVWKRLGKDYLGFLISNQIERYTRNWRGIRSLDASDLAIDLAEMAAQNNKKITKSDKERITYIRDGLAQLASCDKISRGAIMRLREALMGAYRLREPEELERMVSLALIWWSSSGDSAGHVRYVPPRRRMQSDQWKRMLRDDFIDDDAIRTIYNSHTTPYPGGKKGGTR